MLDERNTSDKRITEYSRADYAKIILFGVQSAAQGIYAAEQDRALLLEKEGRIGQMANDLKIRHCNALEASELDLGELIANTAKCKAVRSIVSMRGK